MAAVSPLTDTSIPARAWRERRAGAVTLFVVFHDMEAPETATMAEDLGRNWFGVPASGYASTHYGVDADSVVSYVPDGRAAYGSWGNDFCVHVEHAGYARQSEAEWLDEYGVAMLDRSARLFADRLRANGLPATFCDATRVAKALASRNPADGGWTTHAVMTQVSGRSGHTDPGAGFPASRFAAAVQAVYDDPTRRPVLVQGDHSGKRSLGAVANAVDDVQAFLKAAGYDLGRFGPNGDGLDGDLGRTGILALLKFKADSGLPSTPIVDAATWALIDGPAPVDPPVAPTERQLLLDAITAAEKAARTSLARAGDVAELAAALIVAP